MKKYKVTAFILIFNLLFFISIGQNIVVEAQSVIDYVLRLQKQNGAFGPENKEYTDLAWTYPAVQTLKILKSDIPNEDSCFVNGNKSWIEIEAWRNGPWYWSFYQKANLYNLCNRKDSFEHDVNFGQKWTLQFKPRKGYLETRDYPQGIFFDMSSLWYMISAIEMLDGTITNPEYIQSYINARQVKNGGFVDDVTEKPTPSIREPHVVTTYNAVMALSNLRKPVLNKKECIQWIQSCQTSDGGFKWNPKAKSYGNQADVWYTWAAIKALKALDAEPKNLEKCIEWLNSLQNYDGGFGDRPEWNSRLYSTFYAIQSLDILTGDAIKAITKKRNIKKDYAIPEGVYNIYQAHHKSPSGGDGMVDSIAAMGLNLVGVKSKENAIDLNTGMSKSVKAERDYAIKKGYNIEILDSPENYSHYLYWPNGQKADHISNFLIPPDLSNKEVQVYNNAMIAARSGLTWNEFKMQVIEPIQSLGSGTLFYPELDYTMLNAYMVYDDGLDNQHGFNAVPAAHFGNIDWVRHFPYKEKWEGVLPFIADGDAHGDIVKWRPNLEQYRNVYIAKDYKYVDYIDASLNNRSVCVIHMNDGTIRYYGAKPAIDYLKKHLNEWKWWAEAEEKVWKPLFNGLDLSGWKQLGGEAKYKVEDGMIVGTSVNETPNSFLVTENIYENFILELEVKVDSGLNSGIQIRSESKPEFLDGRVHGYQVEIDPTDRAFSGRIWDEARRRKWLDNLVDTVTVRSAFKLNDWNKFRIETDGSNIRTWINGIPIANITDTMTSKGFIGLQVHKINKETPLHVRFRNIIIKEK